LAGFFILKGIEGRLRRALNAQYQTHQLTKNLPGSQEPLERKILQPKIAGK
jgi:hypothetical protein